MAEDNDIDTIAWWITNDGEIIKINNRHSDYVIRHPEKFGLTASEVKDLKDKDEDYIADLATLKGAIHIRYLIGLYTLIFIEYNEVKTRNVDSKLFKFITEELTKYNVPGKTKVQVYDYSRDVSRKFTVDQLTAELEKEMVFENTTSKQK